MALTLDGCKESDPTRRDGGRSVHGTAPRISVRTEHFGSMPTEEFPCAYNTKITQRLCQMGFATSKSNSSLLVRQGRCGSVSILLYVDDLVIADADLDEIGHVKLQLVASFDMKDLGDLHYFLGIEVICTPEYILISQTTLCVEYGLQVWDGRL